MKTDSNILYIGGFDLPYNNAAAQRVIANSKLFSSLGYNINLIGLTKEESKVNQNFIYQGFNCVNLLYPNSLKAWYKYLCTIKLYSDFLKNQKPLIIIAYNFPAISLYKLLIICRKRNIKIISDCTEWYQPQGSIIFKALKKIDIKLRMSYIHKKLDGIIVISHFLKDYYLNKMSKVLYLPPLVDKKDIKWKKDSNKEVENNDILKFIYAGSPGLGNKDRLDLLISALDVVYKNKSIRFNFDIIGINKDQFYEIYSLKNFIIPSFVNFHGRVSHINTLKYLANSDFQIFIRENNLANTAGFPTKFVESISSRVLVVTNFSSDIKDYLIHGFNGIIIDNRTNSDLINSLSSITNLDKNDIKQMKSNIDVDTFDYQRYIESTSKFFKLLFDK